MAFSTVLLPQPLPPITAKMLPRRTSNDRSCWITFGPNASVTSRTDSSGGSPDGEHRVGHHSRSTSARTAKIASSAMTPTMPVTTARVAATPTSAALRPGLKADAATGDADQDGKGNALDEAEHELVERTAPSVWFR